MKTLILGLGNPILSDDGVGIRVTEELRTQLGREEAEVIGEGLAGIGLLERLSGYDRVIIVDAIQTGGEPGTVYRLDVGSIQTTCHVNSPHEINLATALELGKKLGIPLPKTIDIIAVEAADVTSFNENCTPEVENAISVCVEMIIQQLRKPERSAESNEKQS